MPLPASPPITMAQVRAEFGGTAGVTKLAAYVRGGAYVPNTGTNAGVPTSVPIRLNQLCGASALVLAASASPTSVYGAYVPPPAGTHTATSTSTTCTVTGSAGSLTYNWNRVSGDATTVANSSGSSSTTFSASVNAVNNLRSSVWRCTVTDSVLGVVQSNNVNVTLEYII